MPKRIDLWARLSLLLALGLAIVGLCLQQRGVAPFWGGLLLAFGEAALVGGLADWFAVRALFVHPLGLPFPHSALIPRNRRRITREIRDLILKEWLPLSVLQARVEAFDFIGSDLLPLLEPLRPPVRTFLRDLGRELLTRFTPADLAPLVARGLAGALMSENLRPLLADLLRGARERRLMEPLLDDGLRRMLEWSRSRETWHLIRRHVERASDSYQNRGLARTLAFSAAEWFGGLDLDGATTDIQIEIHRFLGDQLIGPSPLKDAVENGLAGVEQRLRDDPEYLAAFRADVFAQDGASSLAPPLEALLSSLRAEGLRELERDNSQLLTGALAFLDEWANRLGDDGKLREQLNGWFRRLASSLLERHHPLLGTLVEEQMDCFTDDALTELIESRVGEDLNWIRLNGTFVGGLIGAGLYLIYKLVIVG